MGAFVRSEPVHKSIPDRSSIESKGKVTGNYEVVGDSRVDSKGFRIVSGRLVECLSANPASTVEIDESNIRPAANALRINKRRLAIQPIDVIHR